MSEAPPLASTGQFQICCNGTIGVEIHRRGLRGLFRRSIEAACLRFNSTHMQVETTAEFSVGDNLVLDLQVLDLRLEELPGKVTRATATNNALRTPDEKASEQLLHFYDIDFAANNQGRDTQHCLRQLQNLYEQQSR